MNNNLINTAYTNNSIVSASINNNLVQSKQNITKIANQIVSKTNTQCFNKISRIIFSVEEYKIIILLKNGTCINQLTFKQLVILAKLYNFTNADLTDLQNNLEFIQYLHDSNIKQFSFLPENLQKNIAIAKMAFFSGNYNFIKYIPPEHQTIEIYKKFLESCLKTPYLYSYVPYVAKKLQTKEIWHSAFAYHKHYFCLKLFELMPEYFKTQEFCLQVCKYSIDNFCCLPDKFKIFSICKDYVLYAKHVDINLIPKKFKDELLSLFITRIKNFSTSIEYKRVETIIGLELLPKNILKNNADIIIASCISSVKAMLKIDNKYINTTILQEIAKSTIDNIPQKYMSIELVLIRLRQCSILTRQEHYIVSKYFSNYKNKIQQVAFKRVDYDGNMNLLQYIPDYLTEEKCYQYIDEYSYNYSYLPNNYKFNVDIILYTLKKDISKVLTLNSNLLSTVEYQKIFDCYPKTPKWEFNLSRHYAHINSKIELLDSIPKSRRSIDIWLYLCNNKKRQYLHEIPEQIFTKENLYYLVNEYIKWNNIIDIIFIENLFCHKFFDKTIQNKILLHSLQCIARSSDVFFAIIKSVKISKDFKDAVLDNIKIGFLGFLPAKAIELYSKTNPIQQAITTNFASDLLSSCYKYNQESRLILPKITQRLIQYITSPQISQLPLYIPEDNLFDNAKITGGRTIQVDTSTKTAIFYKFRKPKEDLTTFIKEGYLFYFLHQDNYGKCLQQRLKSNIPKLQKLVRIPLKNIPKKFFTCEDSIAIFEDKQGVTCIDTLVFLAPTDYLKYAHQIDNTNTANPYEKAEIGILNACHDIGVFTSIGVYHTSTLPAYHFAIEDRKWSALHMLLRELTSHFCKGELRYPTRNDITMVGKLEKWDTTATNRPDYGYTGLRDFGDCEFFGNILGALQHQDSKGVKNFPIIIQNILAANTICECLLASVLLYARLHKAEITYHYKNNDYKHKMANFIENIFSAFLSGRLQTNNINLAKFVQLPMVDYQKWLDRAVTEILYWTANKHELTENTNIDINDHVSEHIKQRKLPENLYEHYDILDDSRFNNYYHEDNLGCNNATFPLLALMNFIFLFNTRINEHMADNTNTIG